MDKVILKCSESIHKTFAKMWHEKDFTDVTLATCDGKQIKAHKVILCSTSKFFSNILVGSSHENSLIYFKGVFFQELELLIQLMYLGECQVDKEILPKFFDLALELKVEGILKEDFEGEKSEYEQRNKDLEKVLKDKESEGGDNNEHQLKPESMDELQCLFETENFTETENATGGDSFCRKREGESDIQTNTPDFLDRFSCDLCSKSFYYFYQLNEHKKIKHEGKRYKCDLCEKSWPKEKQLM